MPLAMFWDFMKVAMLFKNIYFQKGVFFQTVLFQPVFFQTVFFLSVFFQMFRCILHVLLRYVAPDTGVNGKGIENLFSSSMYTALHCSTQLCVDCAGSTTSRQALRLPLEASGDPPHLYFSKARVKLCSV